jgi:inorganic triphosphatase YgiF
VKVEDYSPDITVFQGTEAWPIISEAIGIQELIPLCVTNFVRNTMEINTPDGAVIEVSVDRGEIVAGDKTEKILEIELELKKGDQSAIVDLGEKLANEYLLLAEPRSKYHRALLLAGLIAE